MASKLSKQEMEAKRKKEQQKTLILCIVCAVLIIAAVAAVIVVTVNSSNGGSGSGKNDPPAPSADVDMAAIKAEIDSKSVSDFVETTETTEYVKITVKDHGDVIVRLRPDIAPRTVANYQKLVGQSFYDGLTFHRVYKNFMIQGGDPKGDGTGNSDERIIGEFSTNGVKNDLSHVRGVISMARSGARSNSAEDVKAANNSASCQFFICHADSDLLDTQYAAFGYVVAGLDTVDSVADVEVKMNAYGTEKSVPVEPVTIEKISFVKLK